MKHTVNVWQEPQTIEVYQQSDNVWVAEGRHAGTVIQCDASSKIGAVRRWMKAARTRDDAFHHAA